jgi:hypothetical protein
MDQNLFHPITIGVHYSQINMRTDGQTDTTSHYVCLLFKFPKKNANNFQLHNLFLRMIPISMDRPVYVFRTYTIRVFSYGQY